MGKINIEGMNAQRFLKLADHPYVEEIENGSMDEGRFFMVLKDGYKYADDGTELFHCKSFGSVKEAREALKKVERE